MKYFNTGWYWIDPNLGMNDDAIYVFCNMTAQGETCIHPDIHTANIHNIAWQKDYSSHRINWFSTLRGGFKVFFIFYYIIRSCYIKKSSSTLFFR